MDEVEFTKIGKQLFTKINKPVNSDLLADLYEKHGHLTTSQWEDVCETYRESSNKYPTMPDIRDMIRIKGYGRDQRQFYALVIVECYCGQSFVVKSDFLHSNDSVECPGKFYRRDGCPHNYSAGFLRTQRRENGIIRIAKKKDVTIEVKYFNEPAEREL